MKRDTFSAPKPYQWQQETYVSPTSHKKTLLWVDDYEPALTLYKTLFGISGFSVLTASSGQRALELLKNNHVDAVITDYEMPGMDGMAVAHLVRKLRPSLPIIMFSASTEVSGRVSNIVNAFCDKTESRDKLLAVINQLVYQEDQENSAPLTAASAILEEAASGLAN
jgi:CheY-like chemotaxis protein